MLNQIKKQVEYMLRNCPACRNSDKLLEVKLLKEFYDVEKIDDILDPAVPSLESIRRCRQKIQGEGHYPSDKQIKKARENAETVYKEYFMR